MESGFSICHSIGVAKRNFQDPDECGEVGEVDTIILDVRLDLVQCIAR